MDSDCILACDIEKVCSQYNENLFADHVCSRSCSCLLWGALVYVGLPQSLQVTSTRRRRRHRHRLEGGGVGSAITILNKGACEDLVC